MSRRSKSSVVSQSEEISSTRRKSVPPGRIRTSIQHHLDDERNRVYIVDPLFYRPDQPNVESILGAPSNRRPEGGEHSRNVCTCDVTVQRYCQRGHNPFCSCATGEATTSAGPCEPPNPCEERTRQRSPTEGQGRYKIYTQGERSRNRGQRSSDRRQRHQNVLNRTAQGSVVTLQGCDDRSANLPYSESSLSEANLAPAPNNTSRSRSRSRNASMRRRGASGTTATATCDQTTATLDQTTMTHDGDGGGPGGGTLGNLLDNLNFWDLLPIFCLLWLLCLTFFMFYNGSPGLTDMIRSRIIKYDQRIYEGDYICEKT